MTPALKNLNFSDLLLLSNDIDPATYDFAAYAQAGVHHIRGYCTRCEEAGCHQCPVDSNFKLTHISHASSTDDLFVATGSTPARFDRWHHENVLFIMESPSIDDWELYREVEYLGHHKRPAQYWYWIHENQSPTKYPEHFARFEYGNLFKSIIFTFQLRNAYLTNLVKCGLNDPEGNFKGYREYDPRTVNMCYENFFSKEIQLFNPKVIFCFGANVYKYLYNQYAEEAFPWVVMQLPHPANRKITADMVRHMYYSMIMEGLYEAGIVPLEEAMVRYGEFLTLSKRRNG